METLPVLHDGEYFEEAHERDIMVITFKDKRIDAAGQISAIKGDLLTLAGEGYRRMLLDFQNVKYVSSAFLSTMILLQQAGVEVVLCGAGDQLCDNLQITHREHQFSIYQNVPVALQTMQKP